MGAETADDLRRSGLLCSNVDVIHSRQAYVEWAKEVLVHLTGYRNVTHDILASPDSRRVYLHCTEWTVEEQDIEVPMVIIFHFNADGMIADIDIFLEKS